MTHIGTAASGIAGAIPPLRCLGDYPGDGSHDLSGAGAERHNESQVDSPRAISHPGQRRGVSRRPRTERSVRSPGQLPESLHGSARGDGSSSGRACCPGALDPPLEHASHAPLGQPDAVRARALHSRRESISAVISPVSDTAGASTTEVYRVADGDTITITAGKTFRKLQGRSLVTYAYNGQVPGPRLEIMQGETAIVRFRNETDLPSSIHWHGLRLANANDGVPGLTQPPVPPGVSSSTGCTHRIRGCSGITRIIARTSRRIWGWPGNILVRRRSTGGSTRHRSVPDAG